MKKNIKEYQKNYREKMKKIQLAESSDSVKKPSSSSDKAISISS